MFSLSWSQDITDITFQAKRLLTISNEAGLEVTVDFDKLVRHCQIRHAWARTVHTFQVRADAHTATRVPACVSKFLSLAWQSAWRETLKEEFLAAYSLRVWALVAGKTEQGHEVVGDVASIVRKQKMKLLLSSLSPSHPVWDPSSLNDFRRV